MRGPFSLAYACRARPLPVAIDPAAPQDKQPLRLTGPGKRLATRIQRQIGKMNKRIKKPVAGHSQPDHNGPAPMARKALTRHSQEHGPKQHGGEAV